MLDDDAPKIYGLDNIRPFQTPLCRGRTLRQPLSFENSIAMCGSDGLVSVVDRSDSVWVYDNEPRNKRDRVPNTGMYRQIERR